MMDLLFQYKFRVFIDTVHDVLGCDINLSNNDGALSAYLLKEMPQNFYLGL